MNTRPILLPTLVLAALPAFAEQATPEPAAAPAPTADAQPAPAPATVATASPKTVAARDDLADRTCLRETGTLIRARSSRDAKGCTGLPGRAYTQDDLRRTGQTDIADALRMLDPSIR
ncbi:hypothetical protein [Cognatilysobacter terrigena]|uniref:hypothetical protein n=1 Tax=Cognatilysobacter terrigena TaxID=2488749 RepID=UPI00105D79A4|nr:hypothetical protein [Lysobacter terrigena]